MTDTSHTEQDDFILIDKRDGIAVLTLNRPRARNAVSDPMRQRLLAALAELAQDRSVKGVVLTGADPAFCAGGDIKGMQERLSAPAGQVAFNGWSRQQLTHQTVMALHKLPKPVIAAVNGPAAGLGADMALACDFIIASEQAFLTMSFVQRGLVPDGGGMFFLPRRVGLSTAKELYFSGRRVQAQEALTMGLVDRVAPHAELLERAVEWAGTLSSGSAASLALTKSALNQSFELSIEQMLSMTSQAQAICYTTDAHRASVESFLAASKGRSAS